MVEEEVLWHAKSADEVLAHLQTGREGLPAGEVEERRAKHGWNHLPPPTRRTALRRVFEQFNNVLIYVLIVSGMITLFLGHWVDGSVIFGVVVINALIGFIQEGKAEKALEAIQGVLTRKARVRRQGKREVIPAEELVPGDIVYLESGDGVPADLRLIKARNLLVDESALTGESAGVEKQTTPVDAKAVTGDRLCIAHSGTTVSAGRGVGAVIGTGTSTEIGKISRLMEESERLTTPLLEEIGRLGRVLTLVILLLSALTFAIGFFWRDMDFGEIFLAAVGIAVAAIPEGLPAIITIALALGVRQMARKKAIIRRLPAVETLGSVTVICSDKTGTLTRNEMTVTEVRTASGIYEVSGTGYSPKGEIRAGRAKADPNRPEHAALLWMLRAGLLCNDADLHGSGIDWRIDGDPTEGALLPLAMKAGLDRAREMERFPRIDALPFESERRYMATGHGGEGRPVIFIKGAPETVLHLCDRQLGAEREEELAADWSSRIGETAGRGYRLLAAAYKETEFDEGALEEEIGKSGFVFLGVFALMDPPRSEVLRAVEECKSGGIRVKMITGDYAQTARSIGGQLGIGDGESVLEGVELEELSDEELPEHAVRTDVFARSSPEHKIRLVRALQKRGEIVAMTGDGVNDAPALKQANVGIAMGVKGTEVARQSAQMVLADDNFASIVEAVKEGRIVYDNIKKSILYMLPANCGQAFVLMWAIFFGMELPITPVQILWVNMVTAVTLTLSLAFEPREPDIMTRPPRQTGQSLLNWFGVWRVGFVSVLLLIGVLVFYFWALRGNSVEFARTVAVNTLVLGQIFYLFNARFVFAPTFSFRGLFGNKYVIGAIAAVTVLQVLFTYLPQAHFLFGSESIPWLVWIYILPVGIGIYLCVELEKWVIRTFFNTRSPRIRP